jgi:NTE family protein
LKRADYVVTPELNGTKNTDFTNHDFLIDEGYKAAKSIALQIKNEIEGMFRRKLNYDTGHFKNIVLRNNASPIDTILFNTIHNKDSVSIRDLRFEIYRMLQTDRWKDLQIVIDAVNDSSYISVTAEENPLIKQIIVEGATVVDLAEIDTLLAKNNYRYYNSKNVLNASLEILRLYRTNGYPLARIKEIIFNEISNTLVIEINEGVIGNIEVTGNIHTNSRLISRELPVRIGDFFQYKNAEAGLTNLRSTNLFENIELITKTENDSVNILINVDERISSVLRFGFRIDNENLNQVSIDIRDENFRGTGTEIGATFAGGLRNRYFSVEQKSNRVFDSYLTYKIRAFHEFNDVNVYQEINTNNEKSFRRNKTGEYRQVFYGGSFGIGSQVGRFGNAFMEGRYQRDEVKNKSDFTGDTYKVDISSLRFSIAVDSQNEYPYPSSGFFINAFYETAQTILGGDIGYTKLFIDYKSIFGYESIHVWSFRTMLGFADQTLPLSQQFSLGGQNLFFGLRDNELRGRQIALASLEYRYKLPFKIFFDSYIRMRYDLGSIWSEREAIRFKDLLHGVGTTLSIKTPIGPADFSVGRNFLFKNTLTKNIISRGETFFYFTIGYYY